jgi:hypothetical protein
LTSSSRPANGRCPQRSPSVCGPAPTKEEREGVASDPPIDSPCRCRHAR